MEKIDLLYVIPMIFSLLSFILIFFHRRQNTIQHNEESNVKDNIPKIKTREVNVILKYVPFFSVIAMILGVVFISEYYERKLDQEKLKFLNYQMESKLEELKKSNDSIFISNSKRNNYIDSLELLNKRYRKLLNNVSKQEKITGSNSDIKHEIRKAIEKTDKDISYILKYNKIINIPKKLSEGYTTSNETSNFILTCPNKTNEKFVDVTLRFQDETLIKDIACIYTEVYKIVSDREIMHISSQAYLPQNGINLFRVKNYQNEKNTVLIIGYVLKADVNKDYPNLQHVICK